MQTTSASSRQMRPRSATSEVLLLARWSALVLRRTLGDQRVAFADVAPAALVHGHDHLAAFAEGIGHRPRVGDRDLRVTRTIGDAEVQRIADVAYRAMHD